MIIDAYLAEWLSLILRWAHIITGIAWIGSSFYFIWLDARLNVPPRDPENADIAGDLWAVHGGGFYHAQKYKVAPAQLPEPLHWFKWEAYFTWMTGFALFIVVYYLNAEAMLIDPAVLSLSPIEAALLSVAMLVGGWLLYDGLCRLNLGDTSFAVVGTALLLGLCWGVSHVYTGRGAYMQVGAMLGTIMAANVFFIIIPSQKELVAAKLRGEQPDARLGARAKQRSVHNNYLTLPVVFTMLSTHFAFTYAHAWNWLVLFVIFGAGMLVRHYFNLRHRGRNVVALPIAALVIGVALAWAIAPRKPAVAPAASNGAASDATSSAVASSGDSSGTVAPGATAGALASASFDEVHRIIEARCVSCHSAHPTHPSAPVAPLGVMFDTPRDILVRAPRIYERVVTTQTMPLANLTHMTPEERATIATWYAHGARGGN
ncbi:MAG TPA: urate hydroxylase PuuD [Vicinamibacterales bacterium]